jgi:phosphoribosylaminoimidazole-succinocarboxamide synthase
VQFAFLGEELVCDIPLQELSKEEENAIKSIMEDKATDARTGELISYQKWFSVTELNKAAEFVETLFIKVFKLPEDYMIKIEIEK